MPDLLDPTVPPPDPAPPTADPGGYDRPPGGTPYHITLTQDQIVQFRTLDLIHERALRGEFDAYHGENIIVAPDGTILEHTDVEQDYSLLAAIEQAEAKAVQLGIPPGQLAIYYVTPLEYR